ncbi:hypothetical protein F4810DRAFT_222907 [Camillea tinctor]|nr:hypothetical protein F4810DRAFT_222907 [Camillea tinctor]
MAIRPVLNHAIILVSHEFLEDPPESALALFNLTPASQRGDNDHQPLSRRAHFEDGTYLEFIAFPPVTDPEARKEHRYGQCEEGTVVDWAIRFASDEAEPDDETWHDVFDAMQLRVRDSGTGVIYMQPDPAQGEIASFADHGGHLEWRRELDMIPSEVPYWVLRRAGEQHVTKHHPSGITGLAGVEVRIRAGPERVRSEHRFGLLWETFQTLFGSEPVDVVDERKKIDNWEWSIGGEETQRRIRLVSPPDMARNVEVGLDLVKAGGEVVRLELEGEEMRLGPRPPLVEYRKDYHWEWMR